MSNTGFKEDVDIEDYSNHTSRVLLGSPALVKLANFFWDRGWGKDGSTVGMAIIYMESGKEAVIRAMKSHEKDKIREDLIEWERS